MIKLFQSVFRYSLSDAGCELAHRLEFVDAGDNNNVQLPARVPPLANAVPPRLPALHMSDNDIPVLNPRLQRKHDLSDSDGETTAFKPTGRFPSLHAMSDSEGECGRSLPSATIDK